MKKAIELLAEDHGVVLKKLDEMEAAIGGFRRGDATALDALRDIAAFLKKDVEVHFAKEEKALFPEMEKFIPRDGGPIAVMLMEHEDLNASKAGFLQALGALNGTGGDEVKTRVAENGLRFIRVLRPHIDKEDNILFMMADMHLDESQNEAILKKFQDIERKYQ